MSFGPGRGRGFGGSGNARVGRGNFGALSNGTNGSDATVGKGQNFSQTETVEDVWDDSPSTFSNGFSDSSNGFGSSNGGFGNKTEGDSSHNGSGGFGSSNGFGSGSGSRGFGNKGSGCHKCGEEGHFARECPQGGGGGGGGGNRNCFKCGEEGHFSRECPNPGSGGGRVNGSSGGSFGGSSGGCSSGGGFGGGFGGSSAGGFGSSSGGGFGSSSGNGFGDSSGGGNRGSGGDSGCRNCGEDGHFARECPNPRKAQTCHTCNEEGHIARDCPQNADKPKMDHYVPPDIDNEDDIFKTVQVGINFDRYDKIPVELSGSKPTSPINMFSEAGLLDTIQRNVNRAKYTKPTPIQKYAIPAISAGRDLMGCAQTGSGKTAAFLLPVLNGMILKGLEGSSFSPVQEPQALVIAPTRELAIQIYNECRKFSHGTIVRCVRLYGGTSTGHQLRDLEQGAHIIIATPGRLIDFIGRQKISLRKVQYFILDEADRMLDMGFEPEMRRLVETMGMPSKEQRQTLMFSATFPKEIQQLAAEFLQDYLFLTVGQVGGANQDVTQTILEVSQYEKREKLLELLQDHPDQRILVFVELKRNADFLASIVSQANIKATSIHGDRLQREREQALADFKSGQAPVLVATSVAARGLDIPGVDHVVNYDLPKEIDEYVHRIGRTGRCGNLGAATSFFDPESNGDLARGLLQCLSEAHQVVPDFLERAADGSGYGGFKKSRFGGRDNRAGGGGGDDFGGWDEQPGGTAPAMMGADEDEGWD